ncbi:MAG: hypothetical protein HC897_09975 [Thermoanaerobaculia bacterium]|nr:hypothetical protein [Thermoanaerobaculia bacterium]
MAEIHQHIGAGMDFPLLWASTLSCLADSRIDADTLASPGMSFHDGKLMVPWLITAAIARIVAAEFLIRHQHSDLNVSDFAAYIQKLSVPAGYPSQHHRVLEQSLEALARGSDDRLPDFRRMQSLYSELHPNANKTFHEPPRTIDEIWSSCDPIAVRLALTDTHAGETWFLSSGLRYLETKEGSGSPDLAFCRIFWQITRIRCQLYRAIVQRPLTGGLQWFLRFYSRIASLRRPLSATRLQVSYETAGGSRTVQRNAIAAIEIRTSFRSTAIELADEMRKLLLSWRYTLTQRCSKVASEGARPEVGVVLHFIKTRDPDAAWSSGKPRAFWAGTFAEPRPAAGIRYGGRFSDFFADQYCQAQALAELLSAVPRSLWLVRGIDVASDELGIPTWVFCPLYRFLEGVSSAIVKDPRAERPLALGATAHVGEDFRHLMEGLRRVFEAIRYLLGPRGGGLGTPPLSE